ncbi:putative formyltetrahydrofolate deformylase [Dioscorea sansibarensis]
MLLGGREMLWRMIFRIWASFNAKRSVVRIPDLDPKYKIAVFCQSRDHCLVDLLYRLQEGRRPVDINCVISNHNRASKNHAIRFLRTIRFFSQNVFYLIYMFSFLVHLLRISHIYLLNSNFPSGTVEIYINLTCIIIELVSWVCHRASTILL